MIELNAISAGYGSRHVLREFSFTCKPGEHVVVTGPNGCGKSTLLKTITALTSITSGAVCVDGLDPFHAEQTRDVRAIVGFVRQRPDDQIVATSVLDEVAFGPENLGLAREEIARRCAEALEQVGLTGLEEREPHTLSGGQKQRLVIAGALAMRPRYLLFDEPTSQLDPKGRAEVLDIMRALVSDGVGIVHVTHDETEAVLGDRRVRMGADVRVLCENVRTSAPHMIAVAGTATTLAAIKLGLDEYDHNRVQGTTLARTEIAALRERFVSMTTAERATIVGLEPKRAPVIIAGTLILEELLAHYDIDELTVSDNDALYGILLERAQKTST
ncbi:MAG: ATP-binding cassette domain-containing protein [Coriobacteriia bacterium]|nr:ATP-binding cassette domain-containing protein [Coriobacteriia bacterium]